MKIKSIQEYIESVFHPPYVQLKIEKVCVDVKPFNKKVYRYVVRNHYNEYVCSARLLSTIIHLVNDKFSVN